MANKFMTNKFKYITASISVASILSVPLIYTTACSFNQKVESDQNSGEGVDDPSVDNSNPDNVIGGDGNDDNFGDNNNNGDNNQGGNNFESNKNGSLSSEIVAVNNQATPSFNYSVKPTVSFKDYKLPTIVDGKYNFIHERGELVDFKADTSAKMNVTDFIKSFDYFDYLKKHNENNPDNLMSVPTVDLLLNDLKYLITPIYLNNNESFSAAIDKENTDIAYTLPVTKSSSGMINGQITFAIKSVKKEVNQINLYDHTISLLPNVVHKLTFKFEMQNVYLKTSQYKERFFINWYVPNATMLLDNKEVTKIKNLNPNQNFFSKAFGLEIYNVTDYSPITVENDVNAKAFMSSLKTTTIAENIETTIYQNTQKMLNILPNLKVVLGSLQKDPTIGEFIYDSAQPIANVLYDFNVVSYEMANVIASILKTTATGSSGVLDVILENKTDLSSGLKKLLGNDLGSNVEIIDALIEMLKPNMTKEEIGTVKSLAELFLPESIKGLFNKIMDVLLGSYDANGNKINNGNPYILDLIDYVITDMFDEVYNTFIKDNLNIDKSVIDVFINIYKVLSERTKDANNQTVVDNNRVDFKTHIVTKLFQGTGNKAKEGSWWLIDSMITVLKAFGIDIQKDKSNLFYELITQAYTLDWNKDNVNYYNFMSALNEVKAWVTFLADHRNYDLTGGFVKFSDGSKVKYNNQTYEYDFNYQVKFIFKKDFSFDLQMILDLLPTDLYLEAYKLVGQEWIHTKVAGTDIGIYTKDRYAWANLERLIYRMIPRKIVFAKGDSFNMDYAADTKKLFYAQNKDEDGNVYNGFNSIIGLTTYFNQAAKDKGVFTSTMASAFLPSDYQNLVGKYPFDKTPGYGKAGVIVDVLTEEKTNYKQSTQNVAAVKEFVQKLLVNKMSFNINLIGKDKTSKVNNPIDSNIYTSNKTFKWNDTDLYQEVIKADANPQWNSQKFIAYNNMFKYKDVDNVSYNYNYISSTKGNTTNGTFKRQQAYFDQSSINTLKTDLFSLGSGLTDKNTMVSIKPITNLNVKKIIEISGGAVVNLGAPIWIFDAMRLNINIEMNFVAFQATVMTDTPVLDLTNVNRNNNSYSLSNYQYSNVFNKVFFVPKIKVGIPSF